MSGDDAVAWIDFELPANLIAQYPSSERTRSRLLVVGEQPNQFDEVKFADLCQLLSPDDLVVCNDSRVIAARMEGRKPTGGRVEVFIERIIDADCIWAQASASRPIKTGDQIVVGQRHVLTVTGRRRDLFVLAADGTISAWEMAERFGRIPLPPYIRRATEDLDTARYQTVYAKRPGSVAAPTAGLHFSEKLLDDIHCQDIEVSYLTLHVGAGTFAPIRENQVNQHVLHSERFEITPALCESIDRCKARGGRVIAVGTTVVRTLEHAAMADGSVRPASGETSLFIKPGFQFKIVDAMITNFHLPRSTLLMLVCAFAGSMRVQAAYRHAIAGAFRFYSYGDAMLISRQ